MTLRTFFFFAVVFMLGTMWTTAPSQAQGALAIGIPAGGVAGGFVYGIAYNEPDDNQAKDRAMKLCQGIDLTNNSVNSVPTNASQAQKACKIVTTFHNQCVAVAFNGSQVTPATAVGWGIASDPDKAKARALVECGNMRRQRGATCIVDETICDDCTNGFEDYTNKSIAAGDRAGALAKQIKAGKTVDKAALCAADNEAVMWGRKAVEALTTATCHWDNPAKAAEALQEGKEALADREESAKLDGCM